MIDYIVAESFTLPSKGLIYESPVTPEIKLKSMTTDHEMLRLNNTGDRTYKNMAGIIDECLVEGPGCSSYDLCIGDFQFLMYKLRTVTYDNNYEVRCDCPLCRNQFNNTIDLDTLHIHEYTDEIQKYMSFELPASGHVIELRPQTPRLIDDAKIKAIDMKRRFPSYNGDFQLLTNIMGVIKTVDGKVMQGVELENLIRTLPLKDTNLIVGYTDKITESIGYENSVWQVCPLCGYNYAATFRITGEFFRPSV